MSGGDGWLGYLVGQIMLEICTTGENYITSYGPTNCMDLFGCYNERPSDIDRRGFQWGKLLDQCEHPH